MELRDSLGEKLEEELNSVKKRLETKIRVTHHELKEFTREKLEQSDKQMKGEIWPLDLRMRLLEQLIWNRAVVFFAGAIFGGLIACIGLYIASKA